MNDLRDDIGCLLVGLAVLVVYVGGLVLVIQGKPLPILGHLPGDGAWPVVLWVLLVGPIFSHVVGLVVSFVFVGLWEFLRPWNPGDEI